jgi:nitrogenase molybdenum-iron protein alpha chain
MLKIYPKKTRKKRAKQIVVNDAGRPPEIGANVRTTPGHHHPARLHLRRLQGRGDRGRFTTFSASPTGPVGCGFYAWLTRRNLVRPPGPATQTTSNTA